VADNGQHAPARSMEQRLGQGLTLLLAIVLQAVTGAAAFFSGLVMHPTVWLLLLAAWLVTLVFMIMRRARPIVVLAIALAYAACLVLTIFIADQAGLTGV
jgi:hypothetical protein